MIFYGINPLFEALHSPYEPGRILVERRKKGTRIGKLLRIAESRGIPVERVDSLDRTFRNQNHQGIAAEIPGFGEQPLKDTDVLNDRLLILDGLQDPHNFGAAARVCDAFGFTDILYHRGDSSGITPAAVKVSSGAVFHLRFFVSNLNKAVKKLKKDGYRLLALEAEGDVTIYDADYSGRIALVIGSEGRGVRFNIRRDADQILSIPMHGNVNSLNVSCALSSVLTEAAREVSGTETTPDRP